MSLLTELRDLLPTPVARWSTLLTSTLLLPAFLAPRFLQTLLAPKATEAEIVLAQLLLPALLVLFFAFLSLVSVIRAYHEQTAKHLEDLDAEREKHKAKISLKDFRRFSEPIKYDNRGIV